MSEEINPTFPTPNLNNTFKKLYHQFLHPPSKYSSSSDAKNDVVFTSEVGTRFITGTIVGSALDFLNGPTNLRSRWRASSKPKLGCRKPENSNNTTKLNAGLLGMRGAERSTRLGRFLGLYSMGAETLNYGVFLLRGGHQERRLLDDIVINGVTSGVLLSCYGLRPAAAAAAAVAFCVFTVGDAGVRVALDHAFPKSPT